tara:strand:- start:222 stop:476 length:255 start_codon:yes stop_codon:yes gene_type:complete
MAKKITKKERKATYWFTGWRQVVIKQSFDIEANSQEEANELIWELQNNYELNKDWFDFTTNKIADGDDSPDFYDSENNLVEETA